MMTHAVASVVQRARYVIWRKIMTNETLVIRSQAASYAKGFLAKKYYEEYQELYDAYLTNRGVSIRRNKNLIDERLITNE
jgi:hypothetical protein